MCPNQPVWKSIIFALGAIAVLFTDIAATRAAGNESRSVPEVKPPPVAPARLSDARLRAFAVASANIMEIRKKYWPQVEAAKTEDEMRRITATAQKLMNQAIANQGLTVDQYNGVVQAIQNDKALIKRIKKLEQAMKKEKK